VSFDSLRIGCVRYLNARPLVYGLPGEIIFDHPATLGQQLAAGQLDVALVSSFEFLRNPVYSIVDGISISSNGPVYSVFVAHTVDWSGIKAIELDPASQTSINLLRCLLAETTRETPVAESLHNATTQLVSDHARLLIGDQAIRFRERFGDQYRYWDLGAEWQHVIGLPFVYALWLIQPGIENASNVAARLRQQRDENLARLNQLIASQNEFEAEFCKYYYQHCLRFNFGAREKEGLNAFQLLCEKHKILPQRSGELRIV
jgi:predicted solute-binding protein